MSRTQSQLHPSQEQLTAYFEATLPDDEAKRVDEHLSQCNECLRSVWATPLGDATSDEDPYTMAVQRIDRWTARSHGEAYAKHVVDELLNALVEARPFAPSDQESLRGIREAIGASGRLANSARFVVPDRASGIDEWAAESWQGPADREEDAPPLAFASVEIQQTWGAVETKGPIRNRGSREPARVVGAQYHAVERSGPVNVSDGASPVAAWARDFVLRVQRPLGTPGRVVLLLSLAGAGAAVGRLAEEAGSAGDAPVLVARFDRVPPGEYVVLFEPQRTEPH